MFSFVESFLISLTVKGLLVIFEKPTNPASLALSAIMVAVKGLPSLVV